MNQQIVSQKTCASFEFFYGVIQGILPTLLSKIKSTGVVWTVETITQPYGIPIQFLSLKDLTYQYLIKKIFNLHSLININPIKIIFNDIDIHFIKTKTVN